MDVTLTTFLNPSGLAYVGQAFFKCLSKYGMRVIPIWLAPPDAQWLDYKTAQEMLSAASRPFEQSIQIHAGRADSLAMVKNAKTVIGSIVLEGNRLNPQQAASVRVLDAALFPSYFCRNVCLSSGVPKSKLFHVPYPLDQTIWNPSVHARKRAKNDRFQLLWMNTLYERKGWDIMLRAFWEEFSADDPIELTMKSYREPGRTEPLDSLATLKATEWGIDRSRRAPVQIIDEPMEAKNIPSFIKSFDAYVSPHRSEGFGLNPWHAMALGVPVICTDYGGTGDFAKADTAWLVKVANYSRPSQREIAIFPHLDGSTWAEPSFEDLKRKMRLCLINNEEAKQRAAVGAALVATNHSEKRFIEKLRHALDTVAPGTWEQLCPNEAIEKLANQPSQKFVPGKPLALPEV